MDSLVIIILNDENERGDQAMFKTDKKMLERMYPIGSTVELINMDDPQAPPVGTCGEICHIDDIGQIHVKWENGSGLALVYGVDEFKIVK